MVNVSVSMPNGGNAAQVQVLTDTAQPKFNGQIRILTSTMTSCILEVPDITNLQVTR